MLGISVAIFFPGFLVKYSAKLCFLLFFFSYTIITVCIWKKKPLRTGANLKVAAGVVGLTSVFCAGLIRVDSNTETKKTDHIIHSDTSIDFIKVVVTTAAIEKKNSWKTEADVEEVNENNKWKSATGKIVLYLSKKDFPKPFEYGDVLVVKGYPHRVPSPSNPEEFDYQRFLRFKNIYHQKYVRTGDVRKLGFAPPNWIDYYALKTRHWADSTIKDNVSGDREKGLASALVLGVTDGLDNELLSAYKATGTLHVLAVSGLHVGILYGIIILLLTPLQRFKSAPWIVAFISVVVLWGYAFVTGLSPSVLRAVTMFSFMALA